jgi:hypothetical protein
MERSDWTSARSTIGLYLGARPMLFVAMNASPDQLPFVLPDPARVSWSLVLDTSIEGGTPRDIPEDDVASYTMINRSLAVFAGNTR